MAFEYETYGPFEIERDGNKLKKGALRSFWKQRDIDTPGLGEAIGIYVFAVKSTKKSRSRAWYVGKTDKQNFKKRLPQTAGHFRDALELAKNGKAQLYLIARRTPKRNAFMKPKKKVSPINDALESMLIGSCLTKNKSLINASKVKHLREIAVPGYMNSKKGKPTKAAVEFARMVKDN